MSSGKKNTYKERVMRRKEEKKLEPDTPRYRDRAKERREDQNPDYEASELGSFHAVAPPGNVDLRLADAQKLSIEKSKYLGGDLEHTHLVKGLDYALLNKVRSEIDKKPDSEDENDGISRAIKEDTNVSFRTAIAKSVYQWIIKPQSAIKSNEMFLPGRMAFVYNMEDGFTHDIPTTLHRSKADCPNNDDFVTVSVDGPVLDRISKIMSYLRLGSSGKVLKKKKKEKDPKLKFGANQEDEEKPKPSTEMLPPPPPPQNKNNYENALQNNNSQPIVAKEEEEEDEIFVGEGVDYSVPNKEVELSPVQEDMEESPNRDKQSYFAEPVYGPVPPSESAQTWEPTEGYEATQAQMMMSAVYPGGAEWSTGYPYPSQYPSTNELAPPGYYAEQEQPGPAMTADVGDELLDDTITQEMKDRGLGSVFRRDDKRLQQLRESDERERDPNFVSESYSECYPSYQDFNLEVVDDEDDDVADLSKMDMGGRAKGRLHRWDFETEEEWAKYNDQKEAMPKAAFQFGVKMQDGRKTRKNNKDQKLTNDLHKINKILARKKGEKDGDGDGDGGYDDDIVPSSKKSRV